MWHSNTTHIENTLFDEHYTGKRPPFVALMRKVSKDFFSVIMSSRLVAALRPTFFFEAFYSAIALTESEVGEGEVATTKDSVLFFFFSFALIARQPICEEILHGSW